jgi:uncharacterized damage-inducible protein DinB
MKKARLLLVPILVAVIVATGILLPPAHAQEMSKTAPKPAPSVSAAVLEQWNEVARKLNDMAQDFPEDKYDFKAAPTARSFSERLIHAAYANQFFIAALQGQKMPGMDDPKRDTFKTKADVVAYVKKQFADGAAAIKAKGDKGMSDLVVDPFSNEQTRVSDFAYGFVEHAGEVYGQLTVYYRVASLVPPESRPKK